MIRLLAILSLFCLPAQAVLFHSSGDPSKNTTRPTSELADSGWQHVGVWGAFTGVPVSPNHFLTARHVGGSIGQTFTLQGVKYTTTQRTQHPTVDLALWRVSREFPAWAELYTGSDERGKRLVVFGRGRQRGAEVHVPGASPTSLRGWRWGTADGKLRWGENVVAGIWGGAQGSMLYAAFDRDGGENEAHLTVGDSGGPVFIQEDGVWKLAGIAVSVDQFYSLTDKGPWFDAVLLDVGGLWHGNVSGLFRKDTVKDQPNGWYAVRVSPMLDWIRGVDPLPLMPPPPPPPPPPDPLAEYKAIWNSWPADVRAGMREWLR